MSIDSPNSYARRLAARLGGSASAFFAVAMLTFALTLTGCGEEPTAEETATEGAAGEGTAAAEEPESAATPEQAFAVAVEEAQGKGAWRSQPAFAADFELKFGAAPPLLADLLMTTNADAVRMDLEGGGVVIYDGTDVWTSPAGLEMPPGPRFHALTWPYFLAAPMKLRDPGSHLELTGERQLDGKTYDTARLTFDAGVGDTPDDWYVLYRDPETGRLAAMAYIVTYGTSVEQAGQEPHIIVYEDFEEVDAGLEGETVTLPTRWTFWNWSEEAGLEGEQLGEATLGNPRFVQPDLGAFDRMEGAEKATLPGTGAGTG